MNLTLLMARNRETGKVEILSESRQMGELRKGFDAVDGNLYSEVGIYRNVRPLKRRTFATAEKPKAKAPIPQAPHTPRVPRPSPKPQAPAQTSLVRQKPLELSLDDAKAEADAKAAVEAKAKEDAAKAEADAMAKEAEASEK